MAKGVRGKSYFHVHLSSFQNSILSIAQSPNLFRTKWKSISREINPAFSTKKKYRFYGAYIQSYSLQLSKMSSLLST